MTMTQVTKKVGEMAFVTKVPTRVIGGVPTVSVEDAHRVEVLVGRELIRRGVVTPEAFAFIRKASFLKAVELAGLLDIDV